MKNQKKTSVLTFLLRFDRKNMLSTKERVEVDIIGERGTSAESNDEVVDNVSESDELDLFPGGLELPPMRSPRG